MKIGLVCKLRARKIGLKDLGRCPKTFVKVVSLDVVYQHIACPACSGRLRNGITRRRTKRRVFWYPYCLRIYVEAEQQGYLHEIELIPVSKKVRSFMDKLD